MARPAINSGSAALQAYMQGVANMGEVRARMQAQTAQAINAVGDTFSKWQDDFNKRKHEKWAKAMEEAKFAETKRLNDANIDLAYQKRAAADKKLPHEIKALNAQASQGYANAASTNFATQTGKKAINNVEKNGGNLITPPSATDNTINGTTAATNIIPSQQQQNQGGILGFLGKIQSAMATAQNAKQQKQAANTQQNTLMGS